MIIFWQDVGAEIWPFKNATEIVKKISKTITLGLTLGFTIVMMLVPSGASHALTNDERTAIRSAFMDAARNPELYEAMVSGIRLGPEKDQIFMRYFEDVMTNEAFLDATIQQVLDSGVFASLEDFTEGKNAVKMAFSLGYEISSAMAIRGMGKMSHDDIRSFFTLMSGIFGVVEPRYCRVMLGGEEAGQQDMIEAGFAVMRGMTPAELRTYLALSRIALEGELSGRAARVAPNADQIELANQAFLTKFSIALKTEPEAEAEDVLAVLTNPNAADDMAFCAAGRVLFSVYGDMDGLPGQWIRLMVLQAAN